VTLNNLTSPRKRDGTLSMDATAKTFRYLDPTKWPRSARPAAPKGKK
jgi:type IV pilus assembly protein PilO